MAGRRRGRRALVIAAAAATVVVWLWTGWPVAGLIAGTMVVGTPWLFTVGRDAKAAIARLDAIAGWVRRLRDTVSVGIGLQQAIVTSQRFAPEIVSLEIGTLAARLQAGWAMRDALRELAEDLDDAAGDQVVSALLLHAEDRGERLAEVLTAIADTAAGEVSMRQVVEAQRAEPRLVTRVMTVLVVVVVVVGALNTEYVRPYSTPVGQLVLAGLASMFVLLLFWIRQLTRPVRIPRFLGPGEDQ
jgi:Flp pilus assembly protein TadB